MEGLMALLSESAEVRGCLSLQAFRFLHGRNEEPSDACSLEDVSRRIEAKKGSVRALLIESMLPGSFAFRQLNQEPVSP
jgi:hypothetical protein